MSMSVLPTILFVGNWIVWSMKTSLATKKTRVINVVCSGAGVEWRQVEDKVWKGCVR